MGINSPLYFCPKTARVRIHTYNGDIVVFILTNLFKGDYIMEEIKKLFNEVVTIGFFMFVFMSFIGTTKIEDLVIVGIFIVSYSAAKIKAAAEKSKKFERKGDRKNEKDNKRNS